MTKLTNLNPNAERRGGVVVSVKDSTPTVTPASIKAGKAVVEILKRAEYDQWRTRNEQMNDQLKKLSDDGSCEGVISNHCNLMNPQDLKLLESMIKVTPKITLENK